MSVFYFKDLIRRFRSGDVTSNVEAVASCDAGNYLCDFIYYKSLHELAQNALVSALVVFSVAYRVYDRFLQTSRLPTFSCAAVRQSAILAV